MVVVFAARALGSEGTEGVGSDLADQLHDIGGHALRGRRRKAAVGPFEETSMREADGLHGRAPLVAALRGELGGRPRSALSAEPHARVTTGERQERRGVPGRRELHRGAGDAERFVVGMRVHEEDGADSATLA